MLRRKMKFMLVDHVDEVLDIGAAEARTAFAGGLTG